MLGCRLSQQPLDLPVLSNVPEGPAARDDQRGLVHCTEQHCPATRRAEDAAHLSGRGEPRPS